jgi:transposase-like protein
MPAVRWSIHAASQEFDIHRETLGKRLLAQSIVAGDDGNFSTADICKAIYGDLEGEKLLKTREERIKIERENATQAKLLVPSEVVERVWSSVLIEYAQRVQNSDAPQQLKEELCEILTPATIDEYFSAAVESLEGSASSGSETD